VSSPNGIPTEKRIRRILSVIELIWWKDNLADVTNEKNPIKII